MSTVHKPVLLEEVIKYLNPQPNQNFIDCTLGGGGHSWALFKKIKPNGKILAIDQDKSAIERFKLQVTNDKLQKNRIVLIYDSFVNLKKIRAQRFPYPISGVLLDLGLSSDQLENSGRGFTFQKDEPLDMRFSNQSQLTAEKIINTWPQDEIERVLRNFGEEQQARVIAQTVVAGRKQKPIKTTFQLVDLILKVKGSHIGSRDKTGTKSRLVLKRSDGARRVYPADVQSQAGRLSGVRFGLHPATKTFQALRIAVNDELKALDQVLPQAVAVLKPGGRLAVISFHGLEDKIVKNFFKQSQIPLPDRGLADKQDQLAIKIITKKPISPTKTEVRGNPRSRSARLRVAEKY